MAEFNLPVSQDIVKISGIRAYLRTIDPAVLVGQRDPALGVEISGAVTALDVQRADAGNTVGLFSEVSADTYTVTVLNPFGGDTFNFEITANGAVIASSALHGTLTFADNFQIQFEHLGQVVYRLLFWTENRYGYKEEEYNA